MSLSTDAAALERAITSRLSARAFTRQPVPRELLQGLLDEACHSAPGAAPSWKVYVLQGASRDGLCDKVCAAHDAVRADPAIAARHQEAYDYYPKAWVSPYIERRRENGWGLYGLLGIGKGDKDRMHAQHQRNFGFFDAPVGLVFTIDQGQGRASLTDFGVFLQNLMVGARLRGLHTCPQAAWNTFGGLVLTHVGAGPQELLVCGMALGSADPDALVNSFHTPRIPVGEFTTWLD